MSTSDPSETVLTGILFASLGFFGVCATVRQYRALGRHATLPPRPSAGDGVPPGEVIEPSCQPPALPVGRVPVWFYHPLDLVGAGFIFLIFSLLSLASLRVPQSARETMDPGVLLSNIGFQFFMAGMVVAVVTWRAGLVKWLGLRWRSWPWMVLIAPCAVLTMWALFAMLEFSGYMKWMESLGVETMQDTVKLLQKSKDPLVLGLMAFTAVIAAPVCEEIVFRGYFYPVLKRFSGAWPAAVCSALVFSAAHGSLAALLPLFVFGLLVVLIYEKTGSLWAPVSVHFCFNGATVLLQLAARHFNLPLEGAP